MEMCRKFTLQRMNYTGGSFVVEVCLYVIFLLITWKAQRANEVDVNMSARNNASVSSHILVANFQLKVIRIHWTSKRACML